MRAGGALVTDSTNKSQQIMGGYGKRRLKRASTSHSRLKPLASVVNTLWEKEAEIFDRIVSDREDFSVHLSSSHFFFTGWCLIPDDSSSNRIRHTRKSEYLRGGGSLCATDVLTNVSDKCLCELLLLPRVNDGLLRSLTQCQQCITLRCYI